MAQNRVLKIGIIGLGRSGMGIHGQLLAQLSDTYQITAIADPLEARQQQAEELYGCRAYASWEEMAEQEQLDLVVNASQSELHYPITLELLKRGINVLCEKPLAKTSEEIDHLISVSEETGALLAVFHNSRYAPAYVQLRKVIDSGVLGRILQVDFTNSSFSRRWDWQTLQQNNGGNLMNLGSHLIDQAFQLLGSNTMPEVLSSMARANSFGDAEDYVKLILKSSNGPLIDIELSSSSVFRRDRFIVHGSNGGLHGDLQSLNWKYFKPVEAPEQKLITGLMLDANGEPTYCREELTWYEEMWMLPTIPERNAASIAVEHFYRMLYRTLAEGEPLEVTPEQVRLQMVIIEECRRQNPQIYKP